MDKTKTNKNTEMVKLEEEECYLICDLLDCIRQKANLQRLHKIQMICKELVDYVCKGNVYKYVSRYQAKNHKEDLEKAKQYLNFLEGLENE